MNETLRQLKKMTGKDTIEEEETKTVMTKTSPKKGKKTNKKSGEENEEDYLEQEEEILRKESSNKPRSNKDND